MLGYTLDSRGNRVGLTYPDGARVIMYYDALDRFDHANMAEGQGESSLWSDSYDAVDRLTSRSTANLWGSTWTFDNGLYASGGTGLDTVQVANFSPYTNDTFSYQFDRAHKVVGQTASLNAPLAHPNTASSMTGLSTNIDNQLLNATPGNTLTYDANGNLTGDGTRTYSYDAAGDGRILTATAGSNTSSYSYDPFGRRTLKTANGLTTQFLLDDMGQEVGEYDGSGTLLRRLIYDPHDTAPVIVAQPTAPNAPINPSTNLFDRMGSVVGIGLSSLMNGPASRFAYLPWGDTATGTLNGTSFGFAGYRYDSETGLYHTMTRSYDPRLGRFLQTDPIGQDGRFNLYAYTGGDPINGTDPSGLDDNSGDSSPSFSVTVTAQGSSGLTPSQGAFNGMGSGSHGNPGGSGSVGMNTGGGNPGGGNPGGGSPGGGNPGGGMSTGGMGPLPPVMAPLPVFNPATISIHIIQPSYMYEPGIQPVYPIEYAIGIATGGGVLRTLSGAIIRQFFSPSIAPPSPQPSFFNGTRYTDKVLRQATQNDYHGFPDSVRAFEDSGTVSDITGGDGVTRQMLSIPGGYQGRLGIFDFAKEINGDTNHRVFRPTP